MTFGLTWRLATFRMLSTMSILQKDRVWKLLTRRHGRAAVGSGGVGRRVAFDSGILVVCLVVLVGLVVFGSVLMLLFWVTATLPPSMLRSCPELDLCGGPLPHDGNESLSVDDPLADGLRMTR
jgi:hypothetical protein